MGAQITWDSIRAQVRAFHAFTATTPQPPLPSSFSFPQQTQTQSDVVIVFLATPGPGPSLAYHAHQSAQHASQAAARVADTVGRQLTLCAARIPAAQPQLQTHLASQQPHVHASAACHICASASQQRNDQQTVVASAHGWHSHEAWTALAAPFQPHFSQQQRTQMPPAHQIGAAHADQDLFQWHSSAEPLQTHAYSLSAYSPTLATNLAINAAITSASIRPRAVTPWTLLIPSDWTIEHFVSGPVSSKAEQLLSERKRISNQGILCFQRTFAGTRSIKDTILFPYASTLYLGTLDKDGATLNLKEIVCSSAGPRLDAKLGGNHANLVAFVRDRDLWVANPEGLEQQITFSPDTAVSNGSAEYVMQEEFRRYTAYWWKPSRTTDSGRLERILYMEIDESAVEWVFIARPGIGENVDRYRYPRVGKPNAKARIKIVEFSPRGKRRPIELGLKSPFTIEEMFPWAEYLVRAGWMPDLRSVWVQLLDRSQKHTVVLRIPEELFVHQDAEIHFPADSSPSASTVQVLYEERSPYWINVTDAFSFLAPDADHPSVAKFIWPSERTGFRHLYLITCFLNIPCPSVSATTARSSSSSTNTTQTNSTNNANKTTSKPATQNSSAKQSQQKHQRASSTPSHRSAHRSKRQNTGPINTIPPLFYPRTQARQITTGEWQVVDNPIVVDESRSHVYFIGKKDTPLETHLYVSCFHHNAIVPVPPFSSDAIHMHSDLDLSAPVAASRASAPHAQPPLTLRHIEHNIKRLTVLGRSHSATVDPCGTRFITTSSSICEPPSTHVYALIHPSDNEDVPESTSAAAAAEALSAPINDQADGVAPTEFASNNDQSAVDTKEPAISTSFPTDAAHQPQTHAANIHSPIKTSSESSPSSTQHPINSQTQLSPNAWSDQPTQRIVYMTRQRVQQAEYRASQISADQLQRRGQPTQTQRDDSSTTRSNNTQSKTSENGNATKYDPAPNSTPERPSASAFARATELSVAAYRDYMHAHVFPSPMLLTELVSPHVVQPDCTDALAQERLRQQSLIYEGLPVPEIFSFINSDGVKIYGMAYKPINFREGESYPTILRIYGGPNVQIVTNDFKYPKFSQLFMALKFGFAIVMIDSRGSCDRGLLFESYVRHRMGTVELQDQIEALLYLATNGQLMFTPRSHVNDGTSVVDEKLVSLWNQVKTEKQQGRYNGFVDMDRIAVNGWSYGGYLSLMALCHYPSIFKMSLAGAPVTNWELYDTAYTERYMGLLQENRDGYKRGSVLEYVHLFPDTENRLLVVHGLIDENVHFRNTDELLCGLARHSKPHQVQVYPSERHGLRAGNVIEHFETLMFWWFLTYL